jgi:DMSO reductase anchor subunit
MTLSKATQMAFVGTVISLIVELIHWGMDTFAPELLYRYGYNWLPRSIWLAEILLQTVPLIIFLKVLTNKQKGGSNG